MGFIERLVYLNTIFQLSDNMEVRYFEDNERQHTLYEMQGYECLVSESYNVV